MNNVDSAVIAEITDPTGAIRTGTTTEEKNEAVQGNVIVEVHGRTIMTMIATEEIAVVNSKSDQ